jgi:hypothetical protein
MQTRTPVLLWLLLCPVSCLSWGDRGHEIIGAIADHYLQPDVRRKVDALLRTDASGLTAGTGIAEEATWADRFRDSDRDGTRVRYRQTRAWHFVDIELDSPDLNAACFSHPALPAGVRASDGPADACIVDKIEQFRGELRDPRTTPEERRLALQFLLHLVGDLHQPLHTADRHDRGGNDLRVRTAAAPAGTLHHYWDTVFVERRGTSDLQAAALIERISARDRDLWSAGSVSDWTWETFEIGRRFSYGRLPHAVQPGATLLLDDAYAAEAADIVSRQLQRAGVRLARVLNEALR